MTWHSMAWHGSMTNAREPILLHVADIVQRVKIGENLSEFERERERRAGRKSVATYRHQHSASMRAN